MYYITYYVTDSLKSNTYFMNKLIRKWRKDKSIRLLNMDVLCNIFKLCAKSSDHKCLIWDKIAVVCKKWYFITKKNHINCDNIVIVTRFYDWPIKKFVYCRLCWST